MRCSARPPPPEQLICVLDHRRSRQPRVAPVQVTGAQKTQPADRPIQQLANDRVGGEVVGQRVQVALDDGGSRLFVLANAN